jgi:hypothetical protein
LAVAAHQDLVAVLLTVILAGLMAEAVVVLLQTVLSKPEALVPQVL